tara:strand:- start:884 stop:1201 length:318 start_codon:yes stop_codon:yes gene_type:complete
MKKSQIRNELKFHGNAIGGFALNFKCKENHNIALQKIEKFAEHNQIKDYGVYVDNSPYKTMKGKIFVYIQNNSIDVSSLYSEVAKKAEVVGSRTLGLKCTVDIKS